MRTSFYTYLTSLLLLTTAVSAQNIGDHAPDFTATTLSGSTLKLSDYAGKVVFIFFLGNECPYCKAIGNDTETKVENVYGGRNDFQAIGLDTWDGSSSVTTLTAFKNYTGITYPLCLKSGNIATQYNTTYDRVMVIDKNGIIRHRSNNSTADDLDNAINVIKSYLTTAAIPNVDSHSPGLAKVFPDPVNGTSTFVINVDKPGEATLKVFSLTGQLLSVPFQEKLPSGEYSVPVNTSDYTPGIYICSLKSADGEFVKKLVVR